MNGGVDLEEVQSRDQDELDKKQVGDQHDVLLVGSHGQGGLQVEVRHVKAAVDPKGVPGEPAVPVGPVVAPVAHGVEQ